MAESITRTLALVGGTTICSSGIKLGLAGIGLYPWLTAMFGGVAGITLRGTAAPCARGTLRGMAGAGMMRGTLRADTIGARTGDGTMFMVVPWRMIISCWSAAPWLSVSCEASGELVDGFCRAVVMS